MTEFNGDNPNDALKAIEESQTSKTDPFVCMCFYHPELPPATSTASLFAKIRQDYSAESIGKIFVINATENAEFAAKFGVIPTPAVVIIWHGEPLIIRRPGWDDSAKILGVLKEDQWLSILRFMTALPKNEERKFLSINM